MIGMNVRDQRRLTLVVESAYHICCGDFQDYLQAISLDGISHHGGENLGWETHVSKAEIFTFHNSHFTFTETVVQYTRVLFQCSRAMASG